MYSSFKKLVIDPKKWISVEFWFSQTPRIDTKHIINFVRPKIDEDNIRDAIKNDMIRQHQEGFFEKEVQKEMDARVKKRVEKEKLRISKMPKPIIFLWETLETKYMGSVMTIKFAIDVDTAAYFLRNYWEVEDMISKVDFYPEFENKDIRAKELKSMVKKFERETEGEWYSIGIEY